MRVFDGAAGRGGGLRPRWLAWRGAQTGDAVGGAEGYDPDVELGLVDQELKRLAEQLKADIQAHY